ncbi:hypothetical protein HK100_001745 [Physocladia obscura]|uniref:Uncharacterized protein n=1 Tax=Physocladia obscura TaxID=109957 RepID=A0AAD5T9X2_9FUNG|nr:hypothetical protein HK100_001745 [Physocladia obscura]
MSRHRHVRNLALDDYVDNGDDDDYSDEDYDKNDLQNEPEPIQIAYTAPSRNVSGKSSAISTPSMRKASVPLTGK